MTLTRRSFVVATALATLSTSTALAAKTQLTAVYVKDMHCATCARKIANKLYAVPGVVKVATDYKKGLAVITPQRGKQPSPLLIWEAVEAATFKPIKIASPLGVFSEKPRR